jgi:acyl-CoA reductase-like NAD-dependent aldehyde dehydrogenase
VNVGGSSTIKDLSMLPRNGDAVRPIYVGGDWVATDDEVAVASPADLATPFARTCHAGEAELERAIEAAVAAEEPLAALSAYERGAALRAVGEGILARTDELARQLALEAGKPIRDATTEIERGALTFRVAAEEAERQYGEVLPLDINAASRGRVGIVRHFPIGAIGAISPFNLPLGLAAHKVAPALAVGCPVVLKPPSQTPLTMLSIAELVDATSLPKASSDLGTLIYLASAARLTAWTDEAIQLGGVSVHRGARSATYVGPTVLADVPSTAAICRKGAFGRVAILAYCSDFEEALDQAQAGLFTRDCNNGLVRFRSTPHRVCDRQRRTDMSRGQHAVRRCEGLRPRTRRHQVRDRRHDRASNPSPYVTGLTAAEESVR